MERVAPEPPRVSDIVAEAGSSNKAFYRYFAGKDDVILAVMERGVAIVVSYLQHQMAKETTPSGKLRRWIEGALAQAASASATAPVAPIFDRPQNPPPIRPIIGRRDIQAARVLSRK